MNNSKSIIFSFSFHLIQWKLIWLCYVLWCRIATDIYIRMHEHKYSRFHPYFLFAFSGRLLFMQRSGVVLTFDHASERTNLTLFKALFCWRCTEFYVANTIWSAEGLLDFVLCSICLLGCVCAYLLACVQAYLLIWDYNLCSPLFPFPFKASYVVCYPL